MRHFDLTDRIETGAVQFGDDWPGVFIRGDDALHYAAIMRAMVNADMLGPQLLAHGSIFGRLLELFESCRVDHPLVDMPRDMRRELNRIRAE